MGKPFSEEERTQVQEKLRRTGLKLFSEKGLRGVSIRELTTAAGIAQGGFYTFYKDKTDFVIDLMELRVKEKLALIAQNNEQSLADPMGYMTELFYNEGMRLLNNKVFDNSISGTLELYLSFDKEAVERIKSHYREFVENLIGLWRGNGFTVYADTDGILELIRMAGVMLSNSSMMSESYFGRTYKAFCTAAVGEFLRVSR